MCTVIFIPAANEIYLGSLRDESPKRQKATKPEIREANGISLLSPQDPMGGGSWVGVNNSGNIIVLLNGGFENHERKKNYRKSRGAIVSELLASELPVVEWSLLDLTGIEPFTLIVWSEHNLFQLVWDGIDRHRMLLDSEKSYIWSSSTLYNAGAASERKELFENWLANNPSFSNLSMLSFFSSYNDAENGFIINRKEITKTLSFSYIKMRHELDAEMSYYEFSSNIYTYEILPLKNKIPVCTTGG